MDTKETFGLNLGAMAPRITAQLKEQNLKYKPKIIGALQLCADSVNALWIHSIIGDGERKRITQKVFRQIENHIQEHNKSKA